MYLYFSGKKCRRFSECSYSCLDKGAAWLNEEGRVDDPCAPVAWVSGPEDSSCLFGGSILYELPSRLIILF